MGRKRKNPMDLPARVYLKNGAFYYVHLDKRWERLGTDIAEAKRRGILYNQPSSTFGTMGYFLDLFIPHCENRVKRGFLAQRTCDDYRKNIEPLKLAFGHMLPTAIEPKHISEYLEFCADNARATRGNREKACLSSCMSWMIEKGKGGIKENPCYKVSRNPEKSKSRYVDHNEYEEVRKISVRQVRGLMDFIYRTLQRPQDIIKWTPANIINKHEADGTVRRVIRTKQGKSGAEVDIAITPEIESILSDLRMDGAVTGPGMTLIHTLSGKPYTYDGLASMLRRYVEKAGVKRFSFYDLKGKGATDMKESGVPVELIQVLCGHKSIKTTEKYIKRYYRPTVNPNRTNTKKKKRAA